MTPNDHEAGKVPRKFYDDGWKAYWNGEPFISAGSSSAWIDGWRDAQEADDKGMQREEALHNV